MIDIASAPRVSLADRRALPKTSGLYVVLSDQAVVYVGISVNFRNRWVTSHHKFTAVSSMPNVEICYFEMPIEDARRLETLLIEQMMPPLNSPYAPAYRRTENPTTIRAPEHRKNISWTHEHETYINMLYDQLKADGIVLEWKGEPNASAIILYALKQAAKRKRKEKGGQS